MFQSQLQRRRRDVRKVAQSPLAPAIYGKAKLWCGLINKRLKSTEQFQFDDRRTGSPTLVSVLAGYMPELWPNVLPRITAALPPGDVCFVTPGMRQKELADLCRRQGWSYLSTATNDRSLAQNVCFRLHDKAELIVKLDEDMFLLPGSISALVDEYISIKADGVVDPGVVAPIVPLNGFSYRRLLELLGLLDEFEAQFGRARIGASDLAIVADPLAACWIWQRLGPLEETAARLAKLPLETLLVPVQFSTGFIVFERAFWEMIGRFPVRRRRLVFGVATQNDDEEHLSRSAVNTSRPCVVTSRVFAGHFSFGPQHAAMLALLKHRPEIFRPVTSLSLIAPASEPTRSAAPCSVLIGGGSK